MEHTSIIVALLFVTYTQSTFTPSPTPVPTPKLLGGGYNYFPESVQTFLSTHETLVPWDFSFSYQPCTCSSENASLCPYGSPGDNIVPSFTENSCSYYSRIGGSVESHVFSGKGLKSSASGSTGSGISDTLWRFPEINYLAGSAQRYEDYTTAFPKYSSRSKPIPPEVYNSQFGVEVITNAPGIIRVVMDEPIIRYTLNPHVISIPWKYSITITIPRNSTTPHLRPEPLPLPSPSPFSSPSPYPSPSPSVFPDNVKVPDDSQFNPEPKPINLPKPPPFHWELSTGPLANIPGPEQVPNSTYQFTGSVCSSVFDGTCVESIIKTVPSGSSRTSKLSCVGDDDEIITITIQTNTAQCQLLRIQSNPILIQKMVVIGDFGEYLDLSATSSNPYLTNVPKLREIVIPNIYTTTPIIYNPPPVPPAPPSPSPAPTPNVILLPTPTPTPSPEFVFPVNEMNEPRVYTQYGRGGPNETSLEWRVILSNLLPQPPTQVLDLMYPTVEGGAIIICQSDEPLKELCNKTSTVREIPITADGGGFWFFVNPEIMNWFIGTHSGSDTSGTPNQLGIDPISLLSALEQRLDNGFGYFGADGTFGELPDICNGDVQVTLNADTALDGMMNGQFDDTRPFLFLENFTNWIMDNNMPEIPGVCAIAEKLVQKRAHDGTFGIGVDEYQSGIDLITDTDWVPPGYIRDLSHSINPAVPGKISSYLNSNFTKQVMFQREKGNWFVDGPYLYKRLTNDDLSQAFQQAQIDQGSNLSSLINNIEKNSIVHFLVDISERLMYYASSSSNAYFKQAGTCSAYLTDSLKHDVITGYMTLIVCVPDIVPSDDPAYYDQNQNGSFIYDMFFSCDPLMTLPNGTTQSTPPVSAGQCVTTQTLYQLNLTVPLNGTANSSQTVWSSSCVVTLENVGLISTTVYDTTFVKCEATEQAVCDNLGTCPKNGFFSNHMIFWIAFFIIMGIILLGFIYYMILVVGKPKKHQSISEQRKEAAEKKTKEKE